MEFLKKSVLRTIKENRDLVENVTEIIRNVRDNGDDAILHYNIKFDGNGRRNFRVSAEEIASAYASVPQECLDDMRQAAKHIEAFAQAQKNCLLPLNGIFNDTGGFSGTQNHSGKFLLLLCSGRRLPSFFIGPDVNYTGKNCRC